jgi:hypothetical protein
MMSKRELKWFIIGSFVVCCIIIGLSLWFASGNQKTLRLKCENVGGQLAIIDQRWSGKTLVDVYGCVNK